MVITLDHIPSSSNHISPWLLLFHQENHENRKGYAFLCVLISLKLVLNHWNLDKFVYSCLTIYLITVTSAMKLRQEEK